MKNNNDFPFPSEEELEKICKKLSASDYPYVNYILPKNAKPGERIKYEICQGIVRYQREQKISDKDLARTLGVNEEKLKTILFSKIYLLNLEELINYANNLPFPCEIRIENNKSTGVEVKYV